MEVINVEIGYREENIYIWTNVLIKGGGTASHIYSNVHVKFRVKMSASGA